MQPSYKERYPPGAIHKESVARRAISPGTTPTQGKIEKK